MLKRARLSWNKRRKNDMKCSRCGQEIDKHDWICEYCNNIDIYEDNEEDEQYIILESCCNSMGSLD